MVKRIGEKVDDLSISSAGNEVPIAYTVAQGDDLHCLLCLEIQVEAITLVPCGHSLCLACWNEGVAAVNRTTCCQCNQFVTTHVVAYAMNNVIAGLVALSPGLFARDNVDAYHEENEHDDFLITSGLVAEHGREDRVTLLEHYIALRALINNEEATEAPEAIVGRRRYDRRCKNTINATVLEDTGEGERNAPNDTSRHNRDDTVLEVTGEGERNVPNYTSRRNREATEQIPYLIGTAIQHIYSDDITFDAANHALRVELFKDLTKWEHVLKMGCYAVVMIRCFAFVTIIAWRAVKEMIRWIST
jgi:hypothetical protein